MDGVQKLRHQSCENKTSSGENAALDGRNSAAALL
jgi:hypothetical protein